MTPKQQEALDAYEKHGSYRLAAEALGKSKSNVQELCKAAMSWQNSDPVFNAGALAVGAGSPLEMTNLWAKTNKPDEGGVTYSAQYRRKKDQVNLAESIAKALDSVPAYVRPKPALIRDNDLLTVYPLYDAHIGMMAWGKETRGQDYDLKLAAQDIRQSFSDISEITPDSKEALLILGGDTVHIDDSRNETPASGHNLSADGRYEKVIDSTIEMLSHTIEFLTQKHQSVKVVILRGNHDEHSHIPVKIGLKERYRNTEGISFPVLHGMEKSEIFWHRHGNSTIAAHHGDKSPPQRLCMLISDQCPFYSDTRDRNVYTGHKHGWKVEQFPGITHHQMQAFCPPDDYGAMFGGRRALQCHTYSKTKGLINTALDPIWRM